MMPRYRDLLLHLDGSPRDETLIAVAARLAAACAAHLTALYIADTVLPTSLEAYALAYAATGDAEALLQRLAEQQNAEAAACAERFEAVCEREGVERAFHVLRGRSAPLLTIEARHYDLTIVRQDHPDHPRPPESLDLVTRLLFDSGRPVLILPAFGTFPTLGKRILIGWTASRESARAVNDALPLLAAAESVRILTINPPQREDGMSGADIARHLARHGVRAVADHTVASDISEADVLLNEAFDQGCDLLVVGAYGHSKVREMFLGGVTQRLLEGMTLPVLLSH